MGLGLEGGRVGRKRSAVEEDWKGEEEENDKAEEGQGRRMKREG